MLWIPFALLAALMQACRNAFQKQLSKDVSIAGVTMARFLWASPLVLGYLGLLYYWQPAAIPVFNANFFMFISGAALTQIIATVFMVTLFKLRNYAIGAGLAKSEAVIAALLGVAFFNESLSVLGWAGVMLGAIAIFLLSGASLRQFSWPVMLLGLGSGLSFSLGSLWVRQASLQMGLPFLHGAAWVLAAVILLQSAIMFSYLLLREPATLGVLWQRPKLTLLVSFSSFFGSLGWFTAFSLESVALVKTLGQVEVLFMLLISSLFFKEKLRISDHSGLVLILIAAVAVIWA
ncbi:DMT family transporter [Rheinheimera sp. UJ63]|uniref:DMT family transporter n=1 Tax=Rheinheimera sp. UJ63 TaxID=2910157 RepID=UPI001F25DB11|nr:DMT family transporter [Rheinheimera sp. UJ63]MCF4008973.1 DMT family transporter [Rheinheimera sp. UJ63]